MDSVFLLAAPSITVIYSQINIIIKDNSLWFTDSGFLQASQIFSSLSNKIVRHVVIAVNVCVPCSYILFLY